MASSESHSIRSLQNAVNSFRAAWAMEHREATAGGDATRTSSPPPEFIPWFCGATQLGYLSPARAQLLSAHLPCCRVQAHSLDWDAGAWTAAARSAALQDALLALRARGCLPGWRGEAFAFCPDGSDTALFQAERAGFYFLGMRSDAVHVNGFTADAGMWIARRSASKAVDPGLLDNLCAGGVSAGESLLATVTRELYEEAGIRLRPDHGLQPAGRVVVGRIRDGGWHTERLHVYNLLLAGGEKPVNRDGEVQEFRRVGAAEVSQWVRAHAFTPDAAAAIAHGVEAISKT